MRGVRVVRRKHGKGMFKFPDDRGYYSGGWLRGLRHGLGVQLNLSGKFMGHFKRERRRYGSPGVISRLSANAHVFSPQRSRHASFRERGPGQGDLRLSKAQIEGLPAARRRVL